ncbi:ABC transporter permease [Fusibacter ferrireducens]|uniref:ABC transporter permease n=1 Tax=Fusibacter ferrireducens TaxID=2785058 RepID=A0ABR9ZRR1_9FIRM|nr:ABC transporter permease [Fusibacter ferrireducens]MBF4693142.1 ABC transporter permease [Fusibacter ferrireducens]
MLRLKLRLLKDNTSLYVIMILMSLLLTAVFGNAFNGDYKGTIFIEDTTNSVENSDLIHTLEQEGSFDIKLVSHEEGLKKVSGREGLMFIQLSDEIKIFELKPTVERYQIEKLLNDAVSSRNTLEEYSEKVYQIISENSEIAVDKASLVQMVKVKVKVSEKNDKVFTLDHQIFKADLLSNFDAKIHYMVGMTLFFVTYSLLFTVGDYLEDRRLHTLDRMMVSPISRFQILTANVIPAFLIGAFQIVVMILCGQYLFGIQWGTQVGLILIIGIMYIFTMTALSFFIVSLVKNMSQLGAISPIILTGMGMLGGCMWPLEIISSKMLLTLANLTPHRWAIHGIETLMITGRASEQTVIAVGILFLMGCVYMVLAERMLAYKISD